MVGIDFPKIEFEMLGLMLLEPMAIITDTIMGAISIFFAYKVSQIKSELNFYKFWKYFFMVFGVGAVLGGLGHTFYNQFGTLGKIPAWLLGPLSIYFAERAMISLYWDKSIQSKILKWFNVKLIITYSLFIYLLLFSVSPEKPTIPFLPIAINTIVGLVLTTGVLGFKYTEKFSIKFRYFWLGVLIMLPTSFIFLLKINVAQWFDKNDFSHVLITIGITYFYLGIFNLSNGLKSSRI